MERGGGRVRSRMLLGRHLSATRAMNGTYFESAALDLSARDPTCSLSPGANAGYQRKASAMPDMGHGGTGEIPRDHAGVHPGGARNRARVRCDRR